MVVGCLLLGAVPVIAAAQNVPDARALGVWLTGEPGPINAITDVAGVEVGHSTIIEGDGPLVVGEGPVRTGVTAILPRGREAGDSVFAAWFSLNGNGEMTGTTWIEHSGILETPILSTNTHSVGVVRDAVIAWQKERDPTFLWALPVVAETYDGGLNDINGFHVRPEHAFEALDGARERMRTALETSKQKTSSLLRETARAKEELSVIESRRELVNSFGPDGERGQRVDQPITDGHESVLESPYAQADEG